MNLIIGFDNTDYIQTSKGLKYYESWPNGWPPHGEELEKLLNSNLSVGNTQMFNFVKNTNEFINEAPYLNYPLVEYDLIDENGKIGDFACIKNTKFINGEKYVYPIIVFGSGFLTTDYLKNNPLHISEKVLNDCRNNLCLILFHEFLEGHGFNKTIVKKFLETQSELLKIPLKNLGFADSNYLTPDLQKTYNTFGLYKNYWERQHRYFCHEKILDTKQEKKYYFLCMNRQIRKHRIMLSIEIFNKWNKNFLWSQDKFFIDENIFYTEDYNSTGYIENMVKNNILTKSFYESLPKQIDIILSQNNDTSFRKEIHEQAFINIVTETMFEEESIMLSEKIYKPILALQPFIVVSKNGYLDVMKKLGYQTFHPLINEEYNLIEDDEKRFLAIVAEIDRLNNFSLSEMNNLIQECKEITQHNFNNWKKMNSLNKRDIDFLTDIHTLLQDIDKKVS